MTMLKNLEINQISIPLVRPFGTSFGIQHNKEGLLLKLTTKEGDVGWGEIPLTSEPGYCYETISTALHIIKDFIIPQIRLVNKKNSYSTIDSWLKNLHFLLNGIRGHYFAKSGLDFCFWNLKAQISNIPLYKLLKATKEYIPTGISIGIQKNESQLINLINKALDDKYQRIKIKIEPNNDIKFLEAIRREIGDIPLMVDANSSYTLEEPDFDRLKMLDQYNLMMIEQPLAHDDIIDHATLQHELKTPICLDESIHSLDDTRKAIAIGACNIINIKAARVGGLTEAFKIAEYSYKNNKDVWCGGMLESGIGRIMNIALQANDYFTLPGDTSGSNRYFEKDIISPEVKVENNGTIKVDKTYDVLEDQIEKYTIKNIFFELL